MIVFVMSINQNVYAHTESTTESNTENNVESSMENNSDINTENNTESNPTTDANDPKVETVSEQPAIDTNEDSNLTTKDTSVDKYASYKPYLIVGDSILFILTIAVIYRERKKARYKLVIEK